MHTEILADGFSSMLNFLVCTKSTHYVCIFQNKLVFPYRSKLDALKLHFPDFMKNRKIRIWFCVLLTTSPIFYELLSLKYGWVSFQMLFDCGGV